MAMTACPGVTLGSVSNVSPNARDQASITRRGSPKVVIEPLTTGVAALRFAQLRAEVSLMGELQPVGAKIRRPPEGT